MDLSTVQSLLTLKTRSCFVFNFLSYPAHTHTDRNENLTFSSAIHSGDNDWVSDFILEWICYQFTRVVHILSVLSHSWLGDSRTIQPVKKFTISNIHRRPFGVTWSNLWKNMLVKQKLYTESWNLLPELSWNKGWNEFVFAVIHQSTKTYRKNILIVCHFTRLFQSEFAVTHWSVKVNCAILHWSIGGVLISLPKAMRP